MKVGKQTMSYYRVIPRDLFNESKLLKCLGQLSLIIHDGVKVPRDMELWQEDSSAGFQIEQNEASGALYCSTLQLLYRSRSIELSCPYNSKDAYPLRYVIDDENEGCVFDETGALSADFLAAMGAVK